MGVTKNVFCSGASLIYFLKLVKKMLMFFQVVFYRFGQDAQGYFASTPGYIQNVLGQAKSRTLAPYFFHQGDTSFRIGSKMRTTPGRVAMKKVVGTDGYLLKAI